MAFSFFQMPAQLVYSHPGDNDLLNSQALAAAYANGGPFENAEGLQRPLVDASVDNLYSSAFDGQDEESGIRPGEGGTWDRNGAWASPEAAGALQRNDAPLAFNPNLRLSYLDETDPGYSGQSAYDPDEVRNAFQGGAELVNASETPILSRQPTRLEAALANIQPMEADPEARRRAAFLSAPDSMAGVHAVRRELAAQAGVPDQWQAHSIRELESIIAKKGQGDLEQPQLIEGAAIATTPNPVTTADKAASSAAGADYGDFPLIGAGAPALAVQAAPKGGKDGGSAPQWQQAWEREHTNPQATPMPEYPNAPRDRSAPMPEHLVGPKASVSVVTPQALGADLAFQRPHYGTPLDQPVESASRLVYTSGAGRERDRANELATYAALGMERPVPASEAMLAAMNSNVGKPGSTYNLPLRDELPPMNRRFAVRSPYSYWS